MSLIDQVEHVEELLPAEVAGVWFERLEPMHEYHSIVLVQEVLGRGGAPRAGTKVVHETHRIMLQRHCGTARLQESMDFEQCFGNRDSEIDYFTIPFAPFFTNIIIYSP